jgi:hypothetical protein
MNADKEEMHGYLSCCWRRETSEVVDSERKFQFMMYKGEL